MYRILNLPVFGLEPKVLADINYWAYRKGYSLFQTVHYLAGWQSVNREIQEKLKTIVSLIEKHSRLAGQKTVSEIILAFLEESGYLQYLTKQDNFAAQQAVSYLNQFYKKISEFENSVDNKSVRNFLQLIELEMEAGEAGELENNFEEGPESVKLMTVHAAKGLEFKYVFIVSLVDRRFPIDDRKDPIELPDKLVKEILPEGDIHLQEERRLFYVAMTRAKFGLFFTSALDCGGARKKKLSRFLLELKALGLAVQGDEPTPKGKSLLEDQVKVIGSQLSPVDLEGILPTRFSFTQLRAFETCPYQYRFAHVLRVPVRGKAQFSFGKTIHATLQQFFDLVKQRSAVVQVDLFGNKIESTKTKKKKDSKPNVSLDELLEIYEKSWIDDWYTSRQEQSDYKQKGRRILNDFYKKFVVELPLPKFLEQPFNLKLKDNGNEYTVKGVIDRVDPLDGGIEIIDYKTGEGKTADSFTAEDKEQLLIYQLATQQVFSEKVKKLSFYYVETGNIISFLGTDKELKNIEQKMINTINEIRKGKFPPKPSKLCQWCDFKNICEFRSL
jgi:DNA helicase-2/ATP-dependent DNA helicase PcrA